MLKIRFQRTGRKNDPAFRIVVTDSKNSTKTGNHVDVVGSYHPKTKDTILKEDAIKKWLAIGAQASGTVHNLLISKGVIEGKKINVLPKKTPIIKEEEVKAEEPQAAPAEAPATPEEAPSVEEVPPAPEEAPEPAKEEEKQPETPSEEVK